MATCQRNQESRDLAFWSFKANVCEGCSGLGEEPSRGPRIRLFPRPVLLQQAGDSGGVTAAWDERRSCGQALRAAPLACVSAAGRAMMCCTGG